MPRTIFHIDVNSAFLSWSAVKRLSEDPEGLDLRTVPSAVGGDVNDRRGVITARSIPAKAFGVQTGEPVVSALRKCPDLILVPSDFPTYRKYSRAFVAVLRRYSEKLEQFSIDEAFLDMSGQAARFGPGFPLNAAEDIRRAVREELRFTVNIGISENRLLAKMASDFEKPDKTHTLWPREIPEKLWPLPISALFGCGGATSSRLRTFGIQTIGDAAGTSQDVLCAILGGRAGAFIHRSANGLDDSPVHTESEAAKSYSNELTTAEDLTDQNYGDRAPELLSELAESVARRMQRDHVRALTLGVMVKTGTFRRHSRQETLPRATNDASVILASAEKLMQELLFSEGGLFRQGEVIRLVGVSASNLDDGEAKQLTLFDWAEEKASEEERQKALAAEQKALAAAAAQKKEREDRLSRMMQMVNERYGADAVFRGRPGGRT